MAYDDIVLKGYVYNDSGTGVNGATVKTYAGDSADTATSGSALATTTTSSDGMWAVTASNSGTDASNRLDVEITSSGGSSKRRIKYRDSIQVENLDTEKIILRAREGQPSELHFFADGADDAGDYWRIRANDQTTNTLVIGSDKASEGTIVDYLTITAGNGTAAGSTVTVGGALTVTGTTTLNGNLVLGDAAADTLTIGATLQGGSPLVFEGATSGDFETTFAITDPTADRTITFPDLTGTVVLGGVSNGSLAITTTGAADLGATTVDSLTSTGDFTTTGQATDWDLIDNNASALSFDASGKTGILDIVTTNSSEGVTMSGTLGVTGTATLATVDIGGGAIDGVTLGTNSAITNAVIDDISINGKVITMTGDTSDTAVFTAGTNGTLSIVTTDAAAAAANIQITADGTAELAGTTVTLDSAADIELEATNDINIPSAVGLTFADDGQKIESDGTDFTIASGAKLNFTPTSDVHFANGTGVVVGHTAQITQPEAGEFQVLGTSSTDAQVLIGRWTNSASGPLVRFVKSRDGVIFDGSYATVADNDVLGRIEWYGDDGTDLSTLAAYFQAEVDDASPEAGGIGTAFVFRQMPGGGTTAAAETMRISAAGNVGLVGNIQSTSNTQNASIATAYANYGLVFRAAQTTHQYSNSIGWSEGTNVAAAISGVDDGSGGAQGLSFATGTNSAIAQRMKITSAGNVGIGGVADPDHLLEINNADGASMLKLERTSGNTGTASFNIGGADPGFNMVVAGTSGDFTIATGGSERVRLDSGGNLGIGGVPTTTAQTKLQIIGGSNLSGGNVLTLKLNNTTAGTFSNTGIGDYSAIDFAGADASGDWSGGETRARISHMIADGYGSTNALGFYTSQADAALVLAMKITHEQDIRFYGASYNVLWDKSANRLEFDDGAGITLGTGGDWGMYHSGNTNQISVTSKLLTTGTLTGHYDGGVVHQQFFAGNSNSGSGTVIIPTFWGATTDSSHQFAARIRYTFNASGSTQTAARGLYIEPPVVTAGTLVNGYGLWIDAGSAATNNYAAHFNGKVGIGTNTPVTNLDVVNNTTGMQTHMRIGSQTVDSNTREGGIQLNVSGGGSDRSWGLWGDANNPRAFKIEYLGSRGNAFGDGTTIATFDYQGNVGIGTSGVPAQRLVVEGGHATVISSRPSNNPTNKQDQDFNVVGATEGIVQVSGWGNTGNAWYTVVLGAGINDKTGGTSVKGFVGTTGNQNFGLLVNGSVRAQLETDGDFHVDGDVYAFSGSVSSDIALKENINIVDNALDKVSKLRGVSFDWKREGKGSSIGLIAQDVEPILPELVSEAPTFGDSTDTHKTLNYNGIIGLLVESIKELKDEIQELKNASSK